MRALIQRVSRARVTVDEKETGAINEGILVLLGITHKDSEKEVDYLVDKIANLRIFPGEKSGFDQSLIDTGGSLFVVSQFTLYGSTKKGRRPDFNDAARPEKAEPLYKFFVQKAREKGLKVETGQFGAHMMVELTNDGPVTLVIET